MCLKHLQRMTNTTYTFACRARRWAPVDIGLTETVQHQVFQSAGTQNAAPIIIRRSGAATGTSSQQYRGDSSTLFSARVSVVQPGTCGDTIVRSVENEPHVERLTQLLAGCLAAPGASTG